jgi:predicted DNA-binding transcriptional regulator AlpA
MPDLVRESEARALLGGISPATFYRGVASGRFPKGVRIGPNSVRYVRAELDACVAKMLSAR